MPNITLGPKFKRPDLLLHPQIPRPLWGFAPRTILGDEWWDETRHTAYAENNYCCHVCGDTPDKPLQAHEVYDYDYENNICTYVETAALCEDCHKFIHAGRTVKVHGTGEYYRVLKRGLKLLRAGGLIDDWIERLEPPLMSLYATWTLVIDGEEYRR